MKNIFATFVLFFALSTTCWSADIHGTWYSINPTTSELTVFTFLEAGFYTFIQDTTNSNLDVRRRFDGLAVAFNCATGGGSNCTPAPIPDPNDAQGTSMLPVNAYTTGYAGFEIGTFSWDAATGRLDASPVASLDYNGDWGFNDEPSTTAIVSGDTLTFGFGATAQRLR